MAEATAVLVPRETVNDDSVKLLAVHVKDGDWVIENQAVADVETSKAVLELEAPCAGFIRVVAKVGSEVGIGLPICFIGETVDFLVPSAMADGHGGSAVVHAELAHMEDLHSPIPATADPCQDQDHSLVALRFTPLAKKLADEAGLSLELFHGVRIVRSADVKAYLAGETLPSLRPRTAPAPATREAVAPSVLPAAVPSSGLDLKWEDLPRRKQVEIKQIRGGAAHILPSSVTVCIPTRGLRAAIDSAGTPGLSSSAVILFEAARLLRKYPLLNAVYHADRVGFYEAVNVGWAVDDGSGLMVPVVRNADTKSLLEIAAETQDLLQRYLMKELSVQDFVGATFTISDLSSEGAFTFAPLVSQGQAAILGVGAEFFAPGSESGLCNLVLAFDHQLADGRIASRFLSDLKARLEAYEEALASSRERGAQTTLYCNSCNRDATTLLKLKAVLLKSELPAGHICSLCLGGY